MAEIINDERLRKLLRSLPKVAIQILHDKYYSSLIKTSTKFCSNHQIAEEIVQEVFLHVWKESKALSEYHDQTLIAYLLKVTRNRSVSYYRSHVVQLKRLDQYLRTEHSEFTNVGPDFWLVQDEALKEIRQAIHGFPKRERQCLPLRIDEDMPIAKIAEQLNVSVKAVERRLTSARRRLRAHLEQLEKNNWTRVGKAMAFSRSNRS